jgi:hypothetical protein
MSWDTSRVVQRGNRWQAVISTDCKVIMSHKILLFITIYVRTANLTEYSKMFLMESPVERRSDFSNTSYVGGPRGSVDGWKGHEFESQ